MSRVFLHHSPPYLLGPGLWLNLELINLVRQASQQTLPVSTSPDVRFQAYTFSDGLSDPRASSPPSQPYFLWLTTMNTFISLL